MMGSNRHARTYTVKIGDLLTALKENRQEHMQIVEEAQAAFRKATIEKLEEMLDQARAGKRVNMHLGLMVPSSHLDTFDNAIGLLEMTKDAGEEVIEITADEYERFVRNRWEWTREFVESNAPYSDRVS